MKESATAVAPLAAGRGQPDRTPSKEYGMKQQFSVFELKTRSHGGEAVWAYRYRIAGRDSRRLQRGGFKTEQAAREALERAERQAKQEESGSPLTDSNRRPPPYHLGLLAARTFATRCAPSVP